MVGGMGAGGIDAVEGEFVCVCMCVCVSVYTCKFLG